MAKLPEKLVQAPAFDSPFRRTSSPELTLIDEPEPPADVVEPVAAAPGSPAAEPARVSTPAPEPVPAPAAEPAQSDAEAFPHRLTVRLSRKQWEAVQTACYRERMAGKKINAAALVREILDGWLADHDAGERER